MSVVALLFGGRSAEHEVSCVSAVSALEALGSKGHEVIPVGIDRDGGWHLADPGNRPLEANGPTITLEMPGGRLLTPQGPRRIDMAFPVLHGPYGEDGTVQGMFEMAGVPYAGAGVVGSAIGMEKDVSKRLCREAGIPIVDYRAIRSRQWSEDPGVIAADIGDDLGFPSFVKPASLGSSVGIARATDEGSLKDAIDDAFAHGDKVLVEAAAPGREIEVAVLEGPRASVPGEIIVHDGPGWYDYDAKYRDDATELVVPAELSPGATAEVRSMAMRAFDVLECRGLARVDFFYDEGGAGFLLNEINTMPGFTPKSMFPMLWAATGLPYADLCDELVSLALS